MIVADFHVHSTFSVDGMSTMEQHCIMAMQKGIKKICFTEHVDYNIAEYNVGKVIDPGCGCGIFLVSAADLIQERRDCCIVQVLNENIYGIEIDEDNVRRCKIVLNLYTLLKGESNNELALNICCADTLKSDWNQLFDCDGFSCIIGNPPYVNTHDMSKETAQFLKKTFKTTKTGVYNIFYAFVEYAMNYLSEEGKLSYIVPNNFLTIKSATDLRELLAGSKWIEKIIDFSDNMVFKPVRTYNCIIQLFCFQTFH